MNTAIDIIPEQPFEDGAAAGKTLGRTGVAAEIARLLANPLLRRSLGDAGRAGLGRLALERLETPPDYARFPELEVLYPERVEFIRGFAKGAGCPLREAATLSYLRFRNEAAQSYEPLQDLGPAGGIERTGCTGVLLVGPDGVLAAHGVDSGPETPRPAGYRHRAPALHASWKARKTVSCRLALKKPRTGYIMNWGVANEKGLGCFAGTSCSTWLDDPIEDTWPVHQVPLLRFAASVAELIPLFQRYTLHNWGRGSQLWADAGGDACVVEKSFRRIGIRRLAGAALWCTEGHFESEEMNAFIRSRRLDYVRRSGKHLGADDLVYAEDCAVRFRHIGAMCHEPLGRGYAHMNRILTDHGVFPRAVCRHGGPDTDAYDQTVTMLSLFADVTHNRHYTRGWIPWKRFPCQVPWSVTQYPARSG